jgi:hypothetical protein
MKTTPYIHDWAPEINAAILLFTTTDCKHLAKTVLAKQAEEHNALTSDNIFMFHVTASVLMDLLSLSDIIKVSAMAHITGYDFVVRHDTRNIFSVHKTKVVATPMELVTVLDCELLTHMPFLNPQIIEAVSNRISSEIVTNVLTDICANVSHELHNWMDVDTLVAHLDALAVEIGVATCRGDSNIIITNLKGVTHLSTHSSWVPTGSVTDTDCLSHIGYLGNNTVYLNKSYGSETNTKFMVGFRGSSCLDSGYIFSLYGGINAKTPSNTDEPLIPLCISRHQGFMNPEGASCTGEKYYGVLDLIDKLNI